MQRGKARGINQGETIEADSNKRATRGKGALAIMIMTLLILKAAVTQIL